ncbi:MAG TPA: hypothetical protein VF771_18215 [Longimicrobiaceae bacterium]
MREILRLVLIAAAAGCAAEEGNAGAVPAAAGAAGMPAEAPSRSLTATRFAPSRHAAGVPAALAGVCQPPGPPPGTAPAPFDSTQYRRSPRTMVRYDLESRLEVPLRCVARTQSEWDRLRPLVSIRDDAALPGPAVDFTHEMVIVAAMGVHNHYFNEIRIDGSWMRGDTLAVAVRQIYPGEGPQPDMLTNPAIATRVPRTAGPVLFVER